MLKYDADTTSSAQLSSAQHSKAQRSTARHSTAQRSTARHSTAQRSTAGHGTAQRSTARQSKAQHSTAQHGTAQHDTACKVPLNLSRQSSLHKQGTTKHSTTGIAWQSNIPLQKAWTLRQGRIPAAAPYHTWPCPSAQQ